MGRALTSVERAQENCRGKDEESPDTTRPIHEAKPRLDSADTRGQPSKRVRGDSRKDGAWPRSAVVAQHLVKVKVAGSSPVEVAWSSRKVTLMSTDDYVPGKR